MAAIPVSEVFVGIYLGLLAAIFPSFIAFSIGFGFKYFTNVTVPGLGVVVLGGALAGVSGGLMGLMEPELAESWTGITAVLVILMACLWAHSQGDKLAVATPRRLTLRTLRENQLSTELAERVDSFGQIRIRPIGEIHDVEGYPPLPDDLRETLRTGSWRFPANLSIAELEARLEERLRTDHELATVEVSVDGHGRAEIRAAPSAAGLSRRVRDGQRAVSIETLLPTGLARGDTVTLGLPDGAVTGRVVSARTTVSDDADTDPVGTADEPVDEAEGEPRLQPPPRTTGGTGQVTVALPTDEARRVLGATFAPIHVRSGGTQRVYEAIAVLKEGGNRFRKLVVGEESRLDGTTIGAASVHETHEVAVLAVRRPTERVLAPRGDTTLQAGDTLFVVGTPANLDAFAEVTG